MKVYELIHVLLKQRAGAEVHIKLRCTDIDPENLGWCVRSGACFEDPDDEDSVIILIREDLTGIMEEWKKGAK